MNTLNQTSASTADTSQTILAQAENWQRPTNAQALAYADYNNTDALMTQAAMLRDKGFRNMVTFSKKVFIPLTQLCRDVCHYCTFAKSPRKIEQVYIPKKSVLHTIREAGRLGCKEALFTLGERPEDRYPEVGKELEKLGFSSTLEYLADVAKAVVEESNVLPHINAGCMTYDEMAMLRPYCASMGLMLESSSERLCEKGMPHYGSPDKQPARRLETLRIAGQLNVPFTTGILIGIGETRKERIESLLAIREIQEEYGHIQEIIVQNFRAKKGTGMAKHPEPDLNELLWTIAVTRMIFGPEMSIQAPPNLSEGTLPHLVNAGINDWGGVSPVTPDFVNPEAPWPHLDKLFDETAKAGKYLDERLTIYPEYAVDYKRWLDAGLHSKVLRMLDAEGYPRTDSWNAGEANEPPAKLIKSLDRTVTSDEVAEDLKLAVSKALNQQPLTEAEVMRMFQARGEEVNFVTQAADGLRKRTCGDEVAYVVNRNINYTNVCYFKCQFCAFSKGKASENLRGKPYDLTHSEITRRAKEAWDRGATEVCMQGGIHPDYTGQTYIDIVEAIKSVTPEMHVHAFSPLEVWQGAITLGISNREFLQKLKDSGLSSLPGTAAEVLDDEVRRDLCQDKINTKQWLEVIETAHEVGLKTTATIMFGHIDHIKHWSRHLLHVANIQRRTGGFTEFVPLEFVAKQSPIYLKGNSRQGPTFRESLLMHAVSRLVFNGLIKNIQTSWVKMGVKGSGAMLNAGANDFGGVLMNETITRSAGASHGQEQSPQSIEESIRSLDRTPRQRLTTYEDASEERIASSYAAGELTDVVNDKPVPKKCGSGGVRKLIRSTTDPEVLLVS